jgi:hypothetical protein
VSGCSGNRKRERNRTSGFESRRGVWFYFSENIPMLLCTYINWHTMHCLWGIHWEIKNSFEWLARGIGKKYACCTYICFLHFHLYSTYSWMCLSKGLLLLWFVWQKAAPADEHTLLVKAPPPVKKILAECEDIMFVHKINM